MTQETAGVRQRTDVTLPEALLREARQLNINLSQACERGLAAAVLEMKAAQWRQENQAADVQADLLDRLETRVVVPLFAEKEAPPPMTSLNPVFDIRGQGYVMVTQSIATLRRRDLSKTVLSLDEQHQRTTNALDMLLTGL